MFKQFRMNGDAKKMINGMRRALTGIASVKFFVFDIVKRSKMLVINTLVNTVQPLAAESVKVVFGVIC